MTLVAHLEQTFGEAVGSIVSMKIVRLFLVTLVLAPIESLLTS